MILDDTLIRCLYITYMTFSWDEFMIEFDRGDMKMNTWIYTFTNWEGDWEIRNPIHFICVSPLNYFRRGAHTNIAHALCVIMKSDGTAAKTYKPFNGWRCHILAVTSIVKRLVIPSHIERRNCKTKMSLFVAWVCVCVKVNCHRDTAIK